MKLTLFCTLATLLITSTFGYAGPPTDRSETSYQSNKAPTSKTTTSGTSTTTDDKRTKEGNAPLSIERSEAHSGGTFMKITWTPSADVGAIIALSKEKVELSYDEYGLIQTSDETLYLTLTYPGQPNEVVFTNLDPSTMYYYAIIPRNDNDVGNGIEIPHYRVAETAHRGVQVTVTKIDMIDDSDDLSDGEVAFTFQLLPSDLHPKEADPTELFDALRWPALTGNEGAGDGYVTFCSGGTAHPNAHLLHFGIGDKVRLAASCYDDDVSGVYDVAPMPQSDEYTGSYNQHHGEANSNFWTLDIDGGTFETETEEFDDYSNSEKFQYKLIRTVSGNDITCLEFDIHLTVSVFYFSE